MPNPSCTGSPKPSKIARALHGVRIINSGHIIAAVSIGRKEYSLHATKGWRCHTIR